MLRPSNSLLGSSRAARRASVRAERLKALGHAARGVRAMVNALVGGALQLALLWTLPFLYLAAAYLALDLPARWLWHRPAFGGWGVVLFSAALTLCLVGIARAIQHAEPVAPVRPKFARAMLGLSWVAALLLTIGDLAS
ncbi:MAG TPA: hypothetical protein VLW85_08575 [Myxococcales bacterium]|nr:hypothetical protein [Myxococcales bacterium]